MRIDSVRRGACVLVTAIALSACGGREGSGGGTIVIGSGQDPKTLFPPAADFIAARQVTELIFRRLADRGPSLNTLGDSGFVPQLAQRWEWSADSARVTFHLDPRARWDDGHAVSAEDVRFGFATFTDPLVASRMRSPLLATADSISVGDSVTCTAWFHGGSPERFDALVTSLFPLPAHLLRGILRDSLAMSAFSRSPVGNGPFKFVRWEQQVRLELAPNPLYPGTRPAVDRVIFAFAPDMSTLFKQLTAGESDFLENLSPADAATAARQPGLHVTRVGSFAYNYLQFNLHDGASDRPHPLFGDRALRRALTMALDRRLLVRSVFDSLGSVGLGPFVRAQWAADTTISQIAYDPQHAAHLLDSLGWRTGTGGMRSRNGRPLAFSILVPTISKPRQSFAVLIQEQLRLAGVTVSVEKLDGAAMFARAAAHTFDAIMGGINTTPPPSGISQVWTSTAAGGSGLNYGRYGSRSFDAQVDSGTSAASKPVAKAHYRAAYQLIVDDAPAIWLYEPPVLIGLNDRLNTGALRPDAWWTGLPGWTIAPGRHLPRDAATKSP